MGIEFLITTLATLISLLLGGLIPLIEKIVGPRAQKYYSTYPDRNLSKFLEGIFHLKKNLNQTYKEKISISLETLKNATIEIDNVIDEISAIGKEKQIAITKLENDLINLSLQENELKQKIETMEKVPVESLRHFEAILNIGDKRGAKRDYILFASGVFCLLSFQLFCTC